MGKWDAESLGHASFQRQVLAGKQTGLASIVQGSELGGKPLQQGGS